MPKGPTPGKASAAISFYYYRATGNVEYLERGVAA
jgi:hypothetical protein